MTERTIFLAVLEIDDPSERSAYLDRACDGDAALRAQVEQLLKAHQEPGRFMECPAPAALATVDEPPVTERPGTVIGPYKLLEQIGEGGFGVVFMAEQQQPLRRKVALKVIKPGMDSKQVIARFEAERQALALMDHPHIAHVLDAGTTDSGRPYFVMELVHGVPITKYCDDNHLTPKARLELFLPVCHAIQHAHQKGIIHRDLKPSNVLVCLYDGVAVPKVIDFGVAKATGQQLTERTMFTQFGTLVGTLEYMSPEQAEMSQLGIDTRSDVYSLGVLLYELLTGTTPLERHRLREAGFDEIRRLIREEEPPKPSTRLSTSGGALAAISAQRQTEPAKLTRLVRGELDWIVMKALEKDRSRRYETANGLARDLQHFLADEPVEACPPTASYRLRKFARKHKVGLASAVGFAALLVLGTAVSAWQAVRATKAEAVANDNAVQAQEKEQEANQQRDEAQRQRDEIRGLNNQLERTLYTAHMNLAQRAWEEADVPRVLKLLEKHRPKPGEPDLRGFEWHYLHHLCQADVLLTLKGDFNSVAFSPDGKHLVGTTRWWFIRNSSGVMVRHDPEVKVCDAQTGQELRTFTLKGAGGNVVFSPDGKRVASTTDNDSTVKVWDAQSGQELFAIKGAGWSLVFSPDSQRLAGASPGTVNVWDAQTGQELLAIQGRTGQVRSMAFSPDGKRLTSAIATWDKTTDNYIAGEVKVWDARTGKELLTINGSTQAFFRATFSPDGTRLATVSWTDRNEPGELKVWDAQTRQQLLSLNGQSDGFTIVAFSPDNKRLITADEKSRTPLIKVWDAQTGQVVSILQGHTSWIGQVAFSPDGKRLASRSHDRTLRIWDLQTGQEIGTLRRHAAGATSLAFSQDGKRLAFAGGFGEGVKVWDWGAQKDQETLALKGIRGHGGGGWLGAVYTAFSPDLKRVAVISSETVKVWDTRNGQETLTLKGHTGYVNSVAFSPDGKRLASGSGDWRNLGKPGEVRVWDAQTGQEILSLKGHASGVFRVAFSPDGKRLASVSAAHTVKVWDIQTGQELLSLPSKERPFNPFASLAFSPDGKRLAAGNRNDNRVKIWDAQTGQELLDLKGHTGSVTPLVFSPDGKRLAGAGMVWDAQTGQELLQGGGDVLAFSPDGKRLAGVSVDNDQVKVWDAQTGQEILTLKAPTSTGGSVAFSPDGHRLGSVSVDGTVKIWDATPLPEKP